MTEEQQFRFFCFKSELYFKRGGVCECCGKFVTVDNFQLAHRIPQSYVSAMGARIIHNEDNLAVTCSLACNKKMDIGQNPQKVNDLLIKIQQKLFEEDNG